MTASPPAPGRSPSLASAPALMVAAFMGAWLVCAWKPWFPQDWALENVLPLLSAWWLLRRHRRMPLSTASYALLTVFGIAHEIGSHYTYAEVPYAAWSEALLGRSLGETIGLQRNHYDRLVHFLFGLLCHRPLREMLTPQLVARSSASRWAPLTMIASISLSYELMEWLAAETFGGELGQAYLGTQGDPWDSQKDSALALLGGLAAGVIDRRPKTRASRHTRPRKA